MNIKKNIFKKSLILITFLTLISCNKENANNNLVENRKKVHTITIESRTLDNIYQSDIILTPKSKIEHKTETKGTIISIPKKNGDFIKKGEVVIKLTKAEVESEYKSAIATLESSKILLDAASTNFEKYKKLFNMGLVSEIDFLNFKTDFSKATSDYLTNKANFENKKDAYDKLTRVALIDGKIGNLFLKEGNDVSQDEILFTIIDESVMEGYIEFPGSLFNNIREGSLVDINITDLNNEKFTGVVTEINPVANPETKKFKLKLSINNANSKIKDGMYGKVSIAFDNKKGLVVPQSAVLTNSFISHIFLAKDGIAKKISVERGIINEPFIEIISREITPGDKVISEGTFGLQDGDKIEEIVKQ